MIADFEDGYRPNLCLDIGLSYRVEINRVK